MSTGGAPNHPHLLADTTRTDLEVAWRERIEEADLLIQAGYLSIGICLKAYALEARIKLRICEHLRLDQLPKDCKTHDLGHLIIFTGLVEELKLLNNSMVIELWGRLVKFSKEKLNTIRYQARSQLTLSDCQALIEAFDEPNQGVFAWLSRPR